MATSIMTRDGAGAATNESEDLASNSPTSLEVPNGPTHKSNGHLPSPLRESHRVDSIDTEFPTVPNGELVSPKPNIAGKDIRSGSDHFPFTAQASSAGPGPTTNGLLNVDGDNSSSPVTLAKKRTNASGTATSPERRSVQFARDTSDGPAPLTMTTTWEMEEAGNETPVKERQGSFFGKLRALASSSGSGHVRNTSSTTTGFETPSAALSPQSERSEPSYPIEPSEGVEADVESETEREEAEEGVSEIQPRQRQKRRRPRMPTAESTPISPRTGRFESRFASFIKDQSGASDGPKPVSQRPHSFLSRTNTDGSNDNARAGLSEDEGRDRIRTAWRRGIEGARGLSYSARKQNAENDGIASPQDARRPSHLRRITGMGGSTLDTNAASPLRARLDRQTTSSVARWRQVKAGLKMLGQRRQNERMRVDHQKSAQLMAELLAGAPAALVVASMFQRDENHHRKIPVLLEQLKIRVSGSQVRNEKSGDRHLDFKIDLEYGNGPARMKWTISRTLRDFINLHIKYQSQATADKVRHLGSAAGDKKRLRMPKFPKSAFPYARNFRGLFEGLADEESEDDEGHESNIHITPNAIFTPGVMGLEDVVESPMTPGGFGPESSMWPPPLTPGIGPGPISPGIGSGEVTTPGLRPNPAAKHTRRKSSVFAPTGIRRTSTGEMGQLPNDPEELDARQRELYSRRQRRKLETYLQQMIRWLIFRPDSTRLCKFLELSALAIRLSAEGGYQGKQGLLTIMSVQGRKLRQSAASTITLAAFKERHSPKWFLVRHSYIVCVDGPESLNPYDVFLVDSDFSTEKPSKRMPIDKNTPQEVAKAMAEKGLEVGATAAHGKHLFLRLYNTERKLKLIARTERQYQQFQESINLMAQATIWSKKQRFASYAPVRNNVWARWLVDGRDHMWQVSRAIDNAKDFVYIHDWWLTPELYMRRPAAISQKWRMDRLLQRKAQEGVKIFVIVYRNIESAIPIDSEYTKWSLLDLHENICIQRSPNQFRQNQFFWAHHEKLVVVDNMMAFVGGIDLCFGRWDDPCHTLTDDKLTGFEINHDGPRDSETCQVWPGKDYSNPRVQDFYALDRPYEEMYDRTRIPRMPWHDIGMQLVGQPARDVGRHFVQRWNYILRSRVPSRPTPTLIPPPEFEQSELENLGMTGTCQVQILRSCGPWSIGTPNKVEHSIMNAYVHLIKHSEHFMYMENQFFVTSCVVEGTTIHNKIGDALVERIIRAWENEEQWGACIVIPLMPGFQNSVDSQDGTSIRLIMQCQFRSICRGETSIFGRLRARGIDPEEYIRFYSLRQWGKIGPRKCLTTEQLYIHAKCMIVDDRSVIIGSANINERSMLGNRDSEVAAVVTDTRMIPSFMGGEPYDVGEFAHTLRKRLMREHLGIDVDAIYRREQATREREEQDAEMARIYQEETRRKQGPSDYFTGALQSTHVAPTAHRNGEVSSSGDVSTNLAGTTRVGSAVSLDVPPERQAQLHERQTKQSTMEKQHDLDVDGYGTDNMKALVDSGDAGLIDSFVDTRGREVLLKKDSPDAPRVKDLEESEAKRPSKREPVEEKPTVRPPYPTERMDTYALGLLPRSQLPELPALDDTDIGGPALTRGISTTSSLRPVNPLMHTLRLPEVREDCMTDPLISTFYYDIWHLVAENNTKIYRQVFRCMPDSEVLDWRTYERFNEYAERFMQSQGLGSSKPRPSKEAPGKSGPPGSAGTDITDSIASIAPETRPRSKSVLSNFVDKLRPSSKLSEEATHTEEAREQVDAENEKEAESPIPPASRASSGPTATPSPNTNAVDEKEALKAADDPVENSAENTPEVANEESASKASPALVDEREGIKQEDMAFTRHRTIQYSETSKEKINEAPETTATQSTNPGGLQHSGSQKRRRRGTTKSSARVVPEEVMGREEAEELLKLVQGRLVLWPYDWYVHIYCLKVILSTNNLPGWRKKSEVGTGCTILTSLHRWKFTIDRCRWVFVIWTRGCERFRLCSAFPAHCQRGVGKLIAWVGVRTGDLEKIVLYPVLYSTDNLFLHISDVGLRSIALEILINVDIGVVVPHMPCSGHKAEPRQ